MSGQTTERAFETCVEEIQLTQGGWESCSNAAMELLLEHLPPTSLPSARLTLEMTNRENNQSIYLYPPTHTES